MSIKYESNALCTQPTTPPVVLYNVQALLYTIQETLSKKSLQNMSKYGEPKITTDTTDCQIISGLHISKHALQAGLGQRSRTPAGRHRGLLVHVASYHGY